MMSSTVQAARAASRSLQGEFSRRIQQLVDALIALRSYVEACLDFPEEEIDFLSDGQVQVRLAAIAEQLHAVEQQAHQGQLLREGMTLVIAGQPNAGKSSLLNALAGREAAIVTPIAGTTRDAVDVTVERDGVDFQFVDTAGIQLILVGDSLAMTMLGYETTLPVTMEEMVERLTPFLPDRETIPVYLRNEVARKPASHPLR